MSRDAENAPGIAAHVRTLSELHGLRIYFVVAGPRLVHANTAALGATGRVEESRLRELEEWIRPGGCPEGIHVEPALERGVKCHMVVELRRKTDSDHAPRVLARLRKLTRRQTDVLVLWCRGWTQERVADESRISIGTVKQHLKEIRAKLGVSTKAEIVAMVREFEAGMRVPE